MSIQLIEGLEVDTLQEETLPRRKITMVRLGPVNVPIDLKDEIETLASNERRSISNACVRLLERGLIYTAAMEVKKGRK